MNEKQPDTQIEEAPPERKFPVWQSLAWILVIGLLVILALGLIRAQKGPVGVGEIAPEFTLTTFDGEEIQTIDHSGQVIVVNFWASWCKPCEQEAADLETAWRYYQSRGDVIFLGVDYVDTQTPALAYLEKFDITYPNGPDLRTRISQDFRISGVPETYFIDRDGRLAYIKIGPFQTLDQILGIIDPLLSE